MNNSSLRLIVIMLVGGAIALFVTMGLFTTDANKIGGFFRYFAAVGVILAAIRPRGGILFLIICSGYLDMLKRFTTLEQSVSQIDIASVLVFAPLLVGGITLSTVLSWGRRGINKETKFEIKIFICCVIWTVLSLVPALSASGLRSLGNVLNYFIYPFLLVSVPRLMRDSTFIKQCVVVFVVSYVPVMALAIYEGNYGYVDITMDYLLAGYSQEIRQLYDVRPGAISTLSGPSSLSIMMSLIAGYLLVPYTIDGKFAVFRKGLLLSLPLAYGFMVAAYYTFGRTGWVVGVIFLGLVALLHMKKFIIYVAGVSTVVAAALFYLSAGYLIDNAVMHRIEKASRDVNTSDTTIQATTLGTFNGRLESMRQVVSDSDIWTPFGFKIAEKEVTSLPHPVHEMIGNLLVRFGYVPMCVMAVLGAFVTRKFLRLNASLPKGPLRNQFRIYVALALACFATAIGHGQTMFVFPINLLWALMFALAMGCYLCLKDQQLETAVSEANQDYASELERAVPTR
ncbi:hypothetical protein JO972_16210 [Verrucomicrobiaceae bacterium 5K15]|uniref:O-antigen ligase domain-containing protein n=1 Tax=Oceaniferula flava TaxID=2800421 RepID=A0AAE2VF23_9BACT|nr:hypothetical protein [Oceaniferula flavus]MBK1856514.1 hypothetical protein [Oceaniferula flavus]MBM1137821.1 hypothetical protein [Oceaniferula flavus]